MDIDPVAGSAANLGADSIAVYKNIADDKRWAVGSRVPVVFAKTGPRTMRVGMIYADNTQIGDYLANASQGSSMLVLGRRPPRGPLASRLGPTAARLIHVSQCPVVLVGSSPVAAAADVDDAGLSLSSRP